MRYSLPSVIVLALTLYAAFPAATQEGVPKLCEGERETESELRERCNAVAKELRNHATAIQEFRQLGGISTELQEGLRNVLARVHDVLELATRCDVADAQDVLRLERERDEITHSLERLDPCEEPLRTALGRLGSVRVGRSFIELCEVVKMRCLYPPHAIHVQQALAGLVPDHAELDHAVELYGETQVAATLQALLLLPDVQLERCLPGARSQLADGLERLRADGLISAVTAAPPQPNPQPGVDPTPAPSPDPPDPPSGTAAPAEVVSSAASPMRSRDPATSGFLTLNVWQSAWGDFSEFESVIVPYLQRNRITEVNLNPGFEMFKDFHEEAYERLKPLVDTLRRGGVERIHFLYAELNYPVQRYAAFLNRFPDLGIRTLVDDSEFTDHFLDRFRRNHAAVTRQGLRYGAFVTLEGLGNSGVSDTTRYWALRRLDEPILMSYFSCSVDEQIDLLHQYLEYADDQRPGVRNVKVALLMGGKRVGREVSCEQQLDARAFQDFVAELDRRLRRYSSYAGIVLETNYRLPRYDVLRGPKR